MCGKVSSNIWDLMIPFVLTLVMVLREDKWTCEPSLFVINHVIYCRRENPPNELFCLCAINLEISFSMTQHALRMDTEFLSFIVDRGHA